MATFPTKEVYKFPGATFIENIHCLPDGKLVLSCLNGPYLLYTLDPSLSSPEPHPIDCHFPPNITGVTGIVPLPGPGNLIAVGGGRHFPFRFELGSMELSIVSLDDEKIVDSIPLPDTTIMNGMSIMPGHPHVVLSADSHEGRIHAIDTKTREVSVLIQDEALAAPEVLPAKMPVKMGINGMRTLGEYVYYANSTRGTFGRFRVDTTTGAVAAGAKVEVLATSPGDHQIYYDFALDDEGNAYVAAHNCIVAKIASNGEQMVIAGGEKDLNDSAFKHPTSATMALDGKSVYVCTGGNARADPPEGGAVMQIMLH